MKKVVSYLFLGIIFLFIQISVVYAHPGRTDSSGCHTCRTNCSSWGLSYGQYHCHNGGSSSSSGSSNGYSATTRRTTTTGQVYGCLDSAAINYNSSANISDGSCQYEKTEVVKQNIYYETITDGELTSGNKKVIQEGKYGEKEVTIKKIVDEQGNEISKETISENVIAEPVDEIVKYVAKTTTHKDVADEEKEGGNAPLIVTIILLIVNIFYGKKNENANLIINKIKKIKSWLRYLLYFIYFIFIIPVFIDIVLVVIDVFKKNK